LRYCAGLTSIHMIASTIMVITDRIVNPAITVTGCLKNPPRLTGAGEKG